MTRGQTLKATLTIAGDSRLVCYDPSGTFPENIGEEKPQCEMTAEEDGKFRILIYTGTRGAEAPRADQDGQARSENQEGRLCGQVGRILPRNPSLSLQALAIAPSKVSMKEEGAPNKNPIIDWSVCPWTDEPIGEWAKWCSAFACSCYLEAGSVWIRHFGSLSVATLWDHCRKSGQTSYPSRACPNPGDLMFFGTLDHVGLIESIDGDSLTTIDGNRQNRVARVTYFLHDLHLYGFARVLE